MDVLAAIHARRGQAAPPRAGIDRTPLVVARLVTEPDADHLAVISIAGSEPLTVPAVPSTYTGVTSVYVSMSDGRPVLVTGPAGTPTFAAPAPTGGTPTSETVTGLVVAPTVSGTWRVDRAAWDRWNEATDVYQAGSASSGVLSGIACYGDGIVNLGLDSITRARLTLVSNGAGYVSSWSAAIKGATYSTLPSSAPTLAATTSSVTVPGYGYDGSAVTLDLDATTRENLRAGTWKALGLGTTGTYGGTRGTRDSRGWVLTIDGTVTR